MLIVIGGVIKDIYPGRGPETDVLSQNFPELAFSLFFPFKALDGPLSLSVGWWLFHCAEARGLLKGQEEREAQSSPS